MSADPSSNSPSNPDESTLNPVPPAIGAAIADHGELTSKSPVSSERDGSMGVPRMQIDWYRSTPWWRLISQSVHISWRISHLIVCLLAIALSAWAWQISLFCFAPGGFSAQTVDPSLRADVVVLAQESIQSIRSARGSLLLDMLPSFDSVLDSLFLSNPWTIRTIAFFVTFVVSMIAIWGFAGGVIARRSLMELGVRTSVGWVPTLKLVAARWRSILWSMMMPVASLAMLAMIPFGLGVIARMGSIGQSIALLASFPCIIIMLGLGWVTTIAFLGFSMSVCAIVAEKGADAFDGLSRASAYVFQRPMTILCILVLGLGVGSIGFWVFDFVLDCGERMFLAAMSVGYGGAIWKGVLDTQTSGKSGVPAMLFMSLLTTLEALRYAYVISFFWTASAAAYLTLRWEIDHTDFDELDLQEIGEPIPIPKLNPEPDSTEPAESV